MRSHGRRSKSSQLSKVKTPNPGVRGSKCNKCILWGVSRGVFVNKIAGIGFLAKSKLCIMIYERINI
ncbi:hypothetical protein Lser_V15G39784 [Lactuca serriola]